MHIRMLLKRIYAKRHRWVHKYDFGHLLIVGGSNHYTGSPALQALAALRAGVDLVTVVAPRRAADTIASFKPDLIAYPLDCDHFTPEHIEALLPFVQNKSAVVVGGGMGRTKEVLEFVRLFVQQLNLPCVIDTDAIYAVAERIELVRNRPFVLTPHSYEFYVLSKQRVGIDVKERSAAVKRFAKLNQTVVLLKGHVDVISDGRQVVLNRTGSPYMTKGGLGDTLAGICGALLARGVKPFEAACAAAHLNGRAGEIAAKYYKESTMASDLIEAIPRAIEECL